MSWSDQDDGKAPKPGPWGRRDRPSGSDGGNAGQSGGPSGGRIGGTDNPFEELRARFEKWSRNLGGGGKRPGNGSGGGSGQASRWVVLVPSLLVAAWLFSGFYRIEPDEQGVVLTFGRWTDTTAPGLHWAWPTPIQSVLTPQVTRDNRVEVGFRSGDGAGAGGRADASDNSLMLTGDQNIVDIHFVVSWRIKDAGAYLFAVAEPAVLVKTAAESAMRQTVGETPILAALTEGRGRIEQDTFTLLQALLDRYGAGIEIRQVQLLGVDPPTPVIDAFNEVLRASADQERLFNEAQAYRNDILPRAEGEAGKLKLDAEAYRDRVLADANGQTKRFLSVLEAYRVNPDVTAETLYLQTMEDILRDAQKVVIDKSAGNGVVPYLPLPGPVAVRPAAAPPPPPAAGPAPSSEVKP